MDVVAKVADSKGRITLGPEYAKKTFLVEKAEGEAIVLRPAEVVPADEAWLWKNKNAFKQVVEGTRDAQMGKLGELDLEEYAG